MNTKKESPAALAGAEQGLELQMQTNDSTDSASLHFPNYGVNLTPDPRPDLGPVSHCINCANASPVVVSQRAPLKDQSIKVRYGLCRVCTESIRIGGYAGALIWAAVQLQTLALAAQHGLTGEAPLSNAPAIDPGIRDFFAHAVAMESLTEDAI